jgi:hypothetical protein
MPNSYLEAHVFDEGIETGPCRDFTRFISQQAILGLSEKFRIDSDDLDQTPCAVITPARTHDHFLKAIVVIGAEGKTTTMRTSAKEDSASVTISTGIDGNEFRLVIPSNRSVTTQAEGNPSTELIALEIDEMTLTSKKLSFKNADRLIPVIRSLDSAEIGSAVLILWTGEFAEKYEHLTAFAASQGLCYAYDLHIPESKHHAEDLLVLNTNPDLGDWFDPERDTFDPKHLAQLRLLLQKEYWGLYLRSFEDFHAFYSLMSYKGFEMIPILFQHGEAHIQPIPSLRTSGRSSGIECAGDGDFYRDLQIGKITIPYTNPMIDNIELNIQDLGITQSSADVVISTRQDIRKEFRSSWLKSLKLCLECGAFPRDLDQRLYQFYQENIASDTLGEPDSDLFTILFRKVSEDVAWETITIIYHQWMQDAYLEGERSPFYQAVSGHIRALSEMTSVLPSGRSDTPVVI